MGVGTYRVRWDVTEGSFCFLPRFVVMKKGGDRKRGGGVCITGVRPCETHSKELMTLPYRYKQHEIRVIEEMVFVTKLSFVSVHKDKTEGFRVTLSSYFCRGYDS